MLQQQQQPPAAAPAAAAGAAATSSSSQNLISSRISEGTFRPPRSVLLRLILRHFWHEIRLCFAVSSGFQKGCRAVAFLLSTLVDGSSSSSTSSSSQNWISSRISEGTFRPPRYVLLQLILRHFWREIGWCFAVSSGFRKGCLAVVFLLLAAAAAVTSNQ